MVAMVLGCYGCLGGKVGAMGPWDVGGALKSWPFIPQQAGKEMDILDEFQRFFTKKMAALVAGSFNHLCLGWPKIGHPGEHIKHEDEEHT